MAHPLTAECSACLEVKTLTEFQQTPLAKKCKHTSTLCPQCFSLSIDSQIRDATIEKLTCPECKEELAYTEIQRFADKELFSRYHRRIIDNLLSKMDNFIWCPLGCGLGLIHYGGNDQPVVYCPEDHRQFCFRHRVPWHSDHTCEEYDSFLQDPQHFRSKAQKQSEIYQTQELNRKRSHQQYLEAEARFAQSLLKEQEAAEARQRARQIRIEQERRLAEERARIEEQERKAREALQHQARLRSEEAATSEVIPRITRRCPACRISIQKTGGCDHMICLKCGHTFNWSQARP